MKQILITDVNKTIEFFKNDQKIQLDKISFIKELERIVFNNEDYFVIDNNKVVTRYIDLYNAFGILSNFKLEDEKVYADFELVSKKFTIEIFEEWYKKDYLQFKLAFISKIPEKDSNLWIIQEITNWFITDKISKS